MSSLPVCLLCAPTSDCVARPTDSLSLAAERCRRVYRARTNAPCCWKWCPGRAGGAARPEGGRLEAAWRGLWCLCRSACNRRAAQISGQSCAGLVDVCGPAGIIVLAAGSSQASHSRARVGEVLRLPWCVPRCRDGFLAPARVAPRPGAGAGAVPRKRLAVTAGRPRKLCLSTPLHAPGPERLRSRRPPPSRRTGRSAATCPPDTAVSVSLAPRELCPPTACASQSVARSRDAPAPDRRRLAAATAIPGPSVADCIAGKHRKHPGGRGNAGGQHHHRILFDRL